jgi:hypothetical protein
VSPTEVHQRFIDHIGRNLVKPGMRYHGAQSMLTLAFKPEMTKPLVEHVRSLLDDGFNKQAFLVYSYTQKSGAIEMICVHRIA